MCVYTVEIKQHAYDWNDKIEYHIMGAQKVCFVKKRDRNIL